MNQQVRNRTISHLQRLISDSAKPDKIRRAAVLRLGRIKAAMNPTPNIQSIQRGKKLAHDTFCTLWAQRGALIRKRRTAAENIILNVLLEELPDREPLPSAPASEWCAFISGITRTLSIIKDLPSQTIKQPTK